jgi:hypothetical protein
MPEDGLESAGAVEIVDQVRPSARSVPKAAVDGPAAGSATPDPVREVSAGRRHPMGIVR